jgi:two-component system response regulator AtoC
VVRTGPTILNRSSFGPVADLIGRVAETDVTVLIRGERGTGKELVARAVHSASPRRERPFVKINCASESPALETELFGCERGAVAGAGQHRPGRIEFAHRGTLFLHHLSELQAGLQLRLQRVLEEGGFARVGAHDPVRTDVRVIAASERDLEHAVAEGLFREALFFRLNVVCLTLPPLRQRRAELRELAEFYVRHYAQRYNKPEVALSAATLRVFAEYHWPLNLEELESVVKGIVLRGTDADVREQLVGSPPEPVRPQAAATAAAATPVDGSATVSGQTVPLKELARQAADGAERALIFRTLQRTRWNRREAAQMLGVSYKALLYKIKRAELEGGP